MELPTKYEEEVERRRAANLPTIRYEQYWADVARRRAANLPTKGYEQYWADVDQREAQARVSKSVEATRIKSAHRLAVQREVMRKRAAQKAVWAAEAYRLDEEEERERRNSSFPT